MTTPDAIARAALHGRMLLALLLAAALLAVTSATPAQAHDAKNWWAHAVPFGSPSDQAATFDTVRGAKARFTLPVGTSSYFAARSVDWRRWGTDRAVGRGEVRFCGSSCDEWRDARIVLAKSQTIDCYHGSDEDKHDYHRVYRSTRVWGFGYPDDGVRRTVPRGSTRC